MGCVSSSAPAPQTAETRSRGDELIVSSPRLRDSAVRRRRSTRRLSAVITVVLFCAAAPGGRAQQDTAAPVQDAPQPVFRAGVNFVRVDVIVTDRKGDQVTSLTKEDFEVFEDDRPQTVEQFKLVDATGAGRDNLPPTELRTRDDELFDAEREDVRVFA